MYFKIAIGNVKKSYKDYSLYFLTITLAVCIFYSFNSLESQKAIIEMKNSGAEYVDMLIDIISGVSVFVSIILGSLIIYANNFLIKKRKKELGIYMTLGMGKNKISKILVMETLIVGICSLVSGLLLGLIVSQGLSVFTASLFEQSMSKYAFVISAKSICKTTLYFGIMFLFVILFNVVAISKYKIIDLLSAGKKNEEVKFKNPLIYVIVFILCVIVLVFAYKLIIEVGLRPDNPMFMISIILGVVGTLLFFFSLSGFGLYVLNKSKKVYFKELNIFVIKQINSKVNTNFLSMSIICLMLFLTIGILSTGISFKRALEEGLKKSTPFDVSGTLMIDEEDKVKDIVKALNNLGINFNNDEKYVSFDEYTSPNITIGSLINKGLSVENKKKISQSCVIDRPVTIMKISDYNAIRELQEKDKISIKSNEVLILSNMGDMKNIVNDFLEGNNKVSINNKEYVVKNKKAIEDVLETNIIANNIFTLVVNDELVNNYEKTTSSININFPREKTDELQEKFSKLFSDFRDGKVDFDKSGFVLGYTKNDIYSESNGMTNTVLFVGIYLGIIFLISSMAVLALQQLSEASDSIDRYNSLKRIGANDQMINKTIFSQILIYFTLPVGLALIHSIVGIKVANDFISMYNKPNIGITSLITAIVFLVVYIGYFYATYIGYKNIIEKS